MSANDRVADLVAGLRHAGLTVAVAESLTGGDLTARLVDVPGASAVLRGGVVTYATDLKAQVLGVDRTLLSTRGAVDAEVARQMADGVAQLLGADVGVATTGVAGPASQDGQPVGSVYVAVSAETCVARGYRLVGARDRLRSSTVGLACALIRAHVLEP